MKRRGPQGQVLGKPTTELREVKRSSQRWRGNTRPQGSRKPERERNPRKRERHPVDGECKMRMETHPLALTAWMTLLTLTRRD